MAEATTIEVPIPINIGGGFRMSFGTFTDAAFAGTDVVTGLNKVLFCSAQNSSQIAMGCKEAATAGTITILATNDGTDDGLWFAVGK